jgi:hypothetical protein
MRIHLRLSASYLSLALPMAMCCQLSSQERPPTAVLKAAEGQLWADFAQISFLASFDPSTLVAQRHEMSSARMSLWRVRWDGPSGTAAYVVGIADNGEILRLGGFSAPQIFDVVGALHERTTADSVFLKTARTAAVLADPDAAEDYEFPFETLQDPGSASRKWLQDRLGSGPDTVVNAINGGKRVRVTVITRARRSYSAPWKGRQYFFEFDNRGELLGWVAAPSIDFFIKVP